MKRRLFSFKNLTVVFSYNIDSPYYLDGDNVIQLDEIWMQKQCYFIWKSLANKRSKVTIQYDNVLIGISKEQFDSHKRFQDQWIAKHKTEPTGSNILKRLSSLKETLC